MSGHSSNLECRGFFNVSSQYIRQKSLKCYFERRKPKFQTSEWLKCSIFKTTSTRYSKGLSAIFCVGIFLHQRWRFEIVSQISVKNISFKLRLCGPSILIFMLINRFSEISFILYFKDRNLRNLQDFSLIIPRRHLASEV